MRSPHTCQRLRCGRIRPQSRRRASSCAGSRRRRNEHCGGRGLAMTDTELDALPDEAFAPTWFAMDPEGKRALKGYVRHVDRYRRLTWYVNTSQVVSIGEAHRRGNGEGDKEPEPFVIPPVSTWAATTPPARRWSW